MSKWDSLKASSDRFFMEVQRIHAHKRIMLRVVNPDYFEQFIKFVMGSRIELKYKLIICLELSSGSRVSEILGLRKKDLIFKDDKIALDIVVKKKRRGEGRELHRFGAVHPLVVKELRKFVFSLGDEDKLFTIHRSRVWEMYGKLFGIGTHSLRHSFVIWCYEKQGMTIEEIVNKLLFSSNVMAQRYYNTRVDKGVWDMFG